MTEYDKISSRLLEMKSRFDYGFSSLDRDYLSGLYFRIFQKKIPNKRCSNCYKDAYVEIFNSLKKMKVIKEVPINYSLKAGEFIHYFGSQEYIINPLTDEVAETFLAKFPKRICIFDRYPEDWRQRCEQRKALLEENNEESKIPVEDETKEPAEENPEAQAQTSAEEDHQEEENPEPVINGSEQAEEPAEEIPMIDENGNIANQEKKPSRTRKTN